MESDHKLSLDNVYLPEYSANPYPLYHQLRKRDPIFWDEARKNAPSLDGALLCGVNFL